jgi:hypothetical protein
MRKQAGLQVDIVIGIVLIALGIALYIATYSIIVVQKGVSATIVPRICAVLLAAQGLVLALGNYRALLKSKKSGKSGARPLPEQISDAVQQGTIGGSLKAAVNVKTGARFFCTLIIFGAYTILLIPVGFLICTPVFLFLLMVWLSPPHERKVVPFVIISAASTLVIYAIFVFGFRVMLPGGLIPY